MFKQYSISEGLPHASINAILQDRNGIMWFGSANGLIRFDGYTFKNYPCSRTLSLLEDKQGYIWVATRGGLYQMNPRTEKLQQFSYNKEDSRSISSNNVYSLFQDDKGELWVGTASGLNRYQYDTQKFEHYLSPYGKEANIYRSIIQDTDGQLLLGSAGGGLIRFNQKTKTFEKIAIRLNDDNPKAKHIYALLLDKKNRLWITTQAGLVEHRPDKQPSKLYIMHKNQSMAYALYMDDSENLWVGYLGDGLCQFKPQSEEWLCFTRETHSYPAKMISAIYQDNNGFLWSSSIYNGVLLFNPRHPFRVMRFDEPFNNISALEKDSLGQLWVGTHNGLLRVDKTKTLIKYYHSAKDKSLIPPEFIKDIYISEDKQIWISHKNGMYRYDPAKDRIVPVKILNRESSKPVLDTHTIGQLNPPELLLSTKRQGLLRWHPSKQYAEPIAFDENAPKGPHSSLFAAFLDSRGRYWSFGYSIIAYLNQASNRLSATEHYPDKPTFFWQMTEDAKGQLWLLSNKAIHKISENGKTEKQFNKSLFNNTALYEILAADDYLWIGSSSGLWQFNPKTQEIQQYTEEDGLQSNDFNWANHLDNDGTIFLGGSNGITIFHPDDIKNTPKKAPRVMLTDLLINNRYMNIDSTNKDSPLTNSISYLDHLQLTSKQSQLFSIEFSALDYFAPDDSQYAYKLEGLNDDWIYTSAANRRAVYTALSPGDYILRIKAANSYDIWNEEGAALKITILPPWWRTVFAYFIYITTFLVSLILFIHYRTAKTKQRAAHLEKQVITRTQEIQQQKKTIEDLLDKKNTLFANVSHELRTPLTLILGPAERTLQRDLDKASNDDLHLIKQNGHRLLNLVDQLLLFSKLSHIDSLQSKLCNVKNTVEMVTASIKSLLDENNLKLHTNPAPDVWLKLTPEDALQTILINLLTNAAKYTSQNGKVSITVTHKSNQWVHIVVADNGTGIPELWKNKIFERFSRLDHHVKANIPGTGLGLALVKELIDINNGHINVTASKQNGAKFEVVLPSYHPTDDEINTSSIHMPAKPVIYKASSSAAKLTEPDKQKSTVLVIEDTADMRNYLASELLYQFNVLLAENGELGLQLIKQHSPDIIICDIMMPGIDGLEVLRRLRSDIEISHIPLILLTAKGGKDNRLKGYQERADDYILKPFDINELKIRVQNILDLRQIWREQAGKTLLNTNLSKSNSNQHYRKSEQTFITNFKNTIDAHYQNSEIKLEDIAQSLNISESVLNRKVKALLNYSPYQYLRIYRLETASQLLKAGYNGNLSELAESLGFSSQQHFTNTFKAHFGVPPKDYLG